MSTGLPKNIDITLRPERDDVLRTALFRRAAVYAAVYASLEATIARKLNHFRK